MGKEELYKVHIHRIITADTQSKYEQADLYYLVYCVFIGFIKTFLRKKKNPYFKGMFT